MRYINMKKITTFTIIITLMLNIFCFPIGASTNVYTLKDSKVLSPNGIWVTSGGAYDSDWDVYNCYAYAINRCEQPQFYTSGNIQYQPGNMSGSSVTPPYSNVYDLADLVKQDLEAIGYTNVQVSETQPSIDATKELICVRISLKTYDDGDANGKTHRYHFMRYDIETNAWYHKPGRSAVLKYDCELKNINIWTNECSYGGIEYAGDTLYNSPILFISYTKRQINVSTSTTSREYINKDKDVFCEVNFSLAGQCTLNLTSDYSVKYELYDKNYNVVASGTGTSVNTTVSVNADKYYLRMNFETYRSRYFVDVSFTHVHNYTNLYEWYTNSQHKSCCKCGAYTLNNHVVKQGSFPSTGGYAICLLCKDKVFMGTYNSFPGSNMPHSLNGSFILPNGIVVLVDADVEAYINGTLVFYSGELQ